MKTCFAWLVACVLVVFPASGRAAAAADNAEATASLGIELSDPVVRDAMNLFNEGKASDAIALLDRTMTERIHGDMERNRELRVLSGILAARSDVKLTDAHNRLRAVADLKDSGTISAKAAAARAAVVWAVKNGVKGDRPDLKKDDDWLRAVDGARDTYAKALNERYTKLDAVVRERQFRSIDDLIKTDRETLNCVLVIRHLPEKTADIRAGFVAKLEQTSAAITSTTSDIRSELADLQAKKSKELGEQPRKKKRKKNKDAVETPESTSSYDDKIELKEKQLDEANKAIEFINRTLQSVPG